MAISATNFGIVCLGSLQLGHIQYTCIYKNIYNYIHYILYSVLYIHCIICILKNKYVYVYIPYVLYISKDAQNVNEYQRNIKQMQSTHGSRCIACKAPSPQAVNLLLDLWSSTIPGKRGVTLGLSHVVTHITSCTCNYVHISLVPHMYINYMFYLLISSRGMV